MLYYTHNYNTRSTQKARFDTKMLGSTKKCPVRQKCPPQHASVDIDIINPPPPPPPLLWEIFLFQFYLNISFLRTQRNENEIILIWIQIYSISLWNLKFNYSSLFVMTIMSATINWCCRYSKIILPIFAFSFDCSIKIWQARSSLLIQ